VNRFYKLFVVLIIRGILISYFESCCHSEENAKKAREKHATIRNPDFDFGS